GSGIGDQGSGTDGNEAPTPNPQPPTPQTLADRWIVSRLHTLTEDVQRLMEDFQFGQAGQLIYEFIWNEFCDWYIEYAKDPLRAGGQARSDTLAVLQWTLDQ